MEIKTREKIYYISFKLFLENGYEATNIRDICKEVGIKASTLYFHYKSKEDLFFYIYDEVCMNYIKFLKEIEIIEQNVSVEEKLFCLLKQIVEYYATDISKQKFILRYHLFPPEEISTAIRERYKFFIREENKIILDTIGECDYKNINEYLLRYKRFASYLVYEMIISSVKFNDGEIRNLWIIFLNENTKS